MKRNVLGAGILLSVALLAIAGLLAWRVLGKEAAPGITRPADVAECGVAWRPVDAAKPSPIYNELHGISALTPNDIWAAGTFGTEDAALSLIEHWDGKQWQHTESPSVPGFSNHLYAIDALTTNDAWAVGAHHNGTDIWRTTAMHWDGSAWKILPTPNIGPISSLNAVAAISTNDVWAVGESSTGSKGQGTQPLLLHWDGSTWSIVKSDAVRRNGTLSAITAVGNEVWAAGSYTDKSGTVAVPLFLHWDGTAWKEVESQGSGEIWGLSAVSPTDVWAVGSFGPQSVAMHWDGAAWTRIPTPNIGTGNNTLNSVAAVASNDVWAVGSGHHESADVAMAMHWDGTSWKLSRAVTLGKYSDVLWSVAALSANEAWAVGASIADEFGNNAPIAEHFAEGCRK